MSGRKENATPSPTEAERQEVPHRLIRLGVICMAKKQESRPMKEFLKRIEKTGNFDITCFKEDMILNRPVETWPAVDCCIPFFSDGFPLDKAIRYAEMHPDCFCLTEPSEQRVLLDRRSVYHALVRNNIPVVRHVVCSRDGYNGAPLPEVVEHAEYVEVNGVRLDKPFVEKPVNSEDHNIRIYYPNGGGSRHLFRKVGNKSSEFYPDVNEIRREGSYIYEEFVATDSAQDVKVYTVGVDYAHAEVRKSPVVDGEVERDENGKEIRQPSPLSELEKQIARKIVKVFRQRVCGFDLLRKHGGASFVCDVNGWSFVKGNTQYYDTASSIICGIFYEEMRKRGLSRTKKGRPGERELKGVVALYRHGDRTPKQKIKLKLGHPLLLERSFGKVPGPHEELVFKGTDHREKIKEWHETIVSMSEDESLTEEVRLKLMGMRDVLERDAEGLKLQIKPQGYDDEGVVTLTQLILKWGGWLTDAGRKQAANLGQQFEKRVMRGDEFVQHMEVFSNNERRVKQTAVEFASKHDWNEKLLNPGTRGKTICRALDDTPEPAKEMINDCKKMIKEIMHADTPEECAKWKHFPGFDAICQLKNTPRRALRHVYRLMQELITHIPEGKVLHRDESSLLMRRRWTSLAENFYNQKTAEYDTTKISDIFDYISYDVSYNQEALFPLDLYPLFELAQTLHNLVAVGEYGLTPNQRLLIGSLIAAPLLREWLTDLAELQEVEEARTRLYFSSESHIQALYNVLYFSGVSPFHLVSDPCPLHYLSSIVMKIYKYSEMDPGSVGRYQMEVFLSTGIDTNCFGIIQDHHVSTLTPMIRIHNNLFFHEFVKIVERASSVAETKELPAFEVPFSSSAIPYYCPDSPSGQQSPPLFDPVY